MSNLSSPQSCHLLLVGASTRAAAWSARHAGFRVTSIDLFADKDLRQLAHRAIHIEADGYPQNLERQIRQLQEHAGDLCPIDAIVYVGGLENHPQLLDALAQYYPIWGTSARSVRQVRDPFQLSCDLPAAVLFPQIVSEPPVGGGDSAGWLCKPYRSAGGRGIRPYVFEPTARCSGRHYYQRQVNGESFGGTFVADTERCLCLGVTRQWISRDVVGHRELVSEPFAYVGSTGLAGDPPMQGTWHRLGCHLAERFALRGLFGVDAVIDETGDNPPKFSLLEVNPRYTASVEVLERIVGRSFLTDHVAACGGQFDLRKVWQPSPLTAVWGKRIVFAPADLTIDSQGIQRLLEACHDASPALRMADIPNTLKTPITIEQGHPICTVLASGEDHVAVERQLGFTATSLALDRLLQTINEFTR